MPGPQIAFLPDGRRLHLQHGPIDLIVDAVGPGREGALRRAAARFETILDELVGELALLRAPVGPQLRGAVARSMRAAVAPFAADFVTPMAAVAGTVADAVLAAMAAQDGVQRAWVNNGGDVALYLAAGESLTAAVASGAAGRVTITAASPVRGVATSGWRGRSQSLGIADGVTVLARSAAEADAAATLIANAVDLPGNPKITRVPARDLAPDSDLGARPVTVDVAPLSADEVAVALARGARFARTCLARDLICAALLTLAGETRAVGAPDLTDPMLKDVCHA